MKTVGDQYTWYRGIDRSGRQILVTVWDNGTCWMQTRNTEWDAWDRPVICDHTRKTPSTPEDAA